MESERGMARIASSGLTRNAPISMNDETLTPVSSLMHFHTAITARHERAVSIPLEAWKKNGPVIRRRIAVNGGRMKRAVTAASRESTISTDGAGADPAREARAEGSNHRGLVNPEEGTESLKQSCSDEKRLLPKTR